MSNLDVEAACYFIKNLAKKANISDMPMLIIKCKTDDDKFRLLAQYKNELSPVLIVMNNDNDIEFHGIKVRFSSLDIR